MERPTFSERVLRRLLPARLLPLVLRDVRRVEDRLIDLERRMKRVQEALGRIEGRQLEGRQGVPLEEREFRVWSQWGEDGILQHMTRVVPLEERTFVEIGVEGYEEANTRFLLVADGWRGLVVEAEPTGAEHVRRSPEYWLHDLTLAEEFVTRENVDGVLRDAGFTGDLGLLSIDVDGVDWWLWEAIEAVRPRIVVVEYNARFGAEEAVTVPYDPRFDRRRAHPSLLYYGASLEALARLGRRKGYALVGSNRTGLNAFFARRDVLPPELPERTAREAWRHPGFCEAHDAEGRRIKMAWEDQERLVRSLPLVRVDEDGRARP